MAIEVYKGNTKLKSAGVKTDMTRKDVEEITRCFEDPIYFIENYVNIVHVDKGLVPFRLYDYQKKMVDLILKERFVIMKLPRQSGKTATTAACVLWYLLIEEFKTVAILANKGSTAREILSRIKTMYENLPKFLQVGVVEWNKGSITLGNGNKCIAAATSNSAIRGSSISWLLTDEFAFVPTEQAQEFFESVYPTISSGTDSKITMFSTPKGLNHFYKYWTEAEEGISQFVPFSIEWNDVPGRGEKFKNDTIATIGEESWRQEFEAVFLGSSNTLINSKKLEQIPIKIPIKSEGGLNVYENPKEGHIYVLGCDAGRGVGKDYSAVQIIDITSTPYKQVAVFADNTVDYVKFTKIIYELGTLYNNGAVIIENNDLGEAILTDLNWSYEYENIVFTRDTKGHTDVTFGNGALGLKTTQRTKKQGCSALKLLVENDKLLLCDKQTIFELSMFTAQGNTFKAEDGFHDDLAMSLVIFAWLTQTQNFEEITQRTETWKMEVAEQFDLPFGLYDDGIEPIEGDPINDELEMGEYKLVKNN